MLTNPDRMLDMGFIHDIRRVLAKLPERRQNLLVLGDLLRRIKRSLRPKLLHTRWKWRYGAS